jgi:hypothetical protein
VTPPYNAGPFGSDDELIKKVKCGLALLISRRGRGLAKTEKKRKRDMRGSRF